MGMKTVIFILWLVALVAGTIGVVERFFYGLSLTNYGSYVTWGLWEAAYIYFIGLSAGAFLLSSLTYVFGIKRIEKLGRLALMTALITLVMALICILLHLGRMERFYRMFTDPNLHSIMNWVSWLYLLYFFVLSAELLLASLKRSPELLKALAAFGIPLAVIFHGGVGALFGVLGARPHWHSALMPILFLIGALASGGGLLVAIVGFLWPDETGKREMCIFLGKILLGLLLCDILLEWAEFSVPLWGGMEYHAVGYKIVLFGPYWWVFWIVHLGVGVIAPLLLLAGFRRSINAIRWAGLLIAATFMSVRLNVIIPGLVVPELKGLEDAFVDSRLTFHYFPSLHEWLVILFVISFGVMLFYTGWRILSVSETKSKVVY